MAGQFGSLGFSKGCEFRFLVIGIRSGGLGPTPIVGTLRLIGCVCQMIEVVGVTLEHFYQPFAGLNQADVQSGSFGLSSFLGAAGSSWGTSSAPQARQRTTLPSRARKYHFLHFGQSYLVNPAGRAVLLIRSPLLDGSPEAGTAWRRKPTTDEWAAVPFLLSGPSFGLR